MRFSIGDRVVVNEIPEIKKSLWGRTGQVLGIARSNVRVRMNSDTSCEEYNFLDEMLMKQGESGNSWRKIETESPVQGVIVEVYGGIAEVTHCPVGVEVDIIDHDNLEAERDM